MAKKEIKTDLWVARQLDDSKIKYDAQGSNVKEINDALQSASKRGTGNAGYPEYVAVVKDFVIVIEDKADLDKHQKLTDTGILSTEQKDIADYAVNGAFPGISLQVKDVVSFAFTTTLWIPSLPSPKLSRFSLHSS